MPLIIEQFEIEDKFVKYTVDAISEALLFKGRALDEDGQKICNTLRKMKGKIVTATIDNYEGIYEFYELKIEPREEIKGRHYIYRFSGVLKAVK